MSYFFLGKTLPDYDIHHLVETLNPCKTFKTKILHTNQGCLAVSYLENAPLKGPKYFTDKDWAAVFAGDLIEKTIPWKLIIETLGSGNYETLCKFNGTFSIAALNKKTNKLFVVSDRRSQLPTFYLISNGDVGISTELSTFCRLPIKLSFNIEWLWEYLFFNYALGQTTFYETVKRMSPACVLEIDTESGEKSFSEYATKFRKKKDLLEGKEAIELAYSVFRKRLPKYFVGADNVACALTSGWDGRTNLSFSPNLKSVVAYTYGVPGCRDLVEASKTTRALGINHHKILFDKRFEQLLPSLMFDTVSLSSGHERITRSTLLYVYNNLTNCGKTFPLTLSGWDLDGQFRGHNNVPSIISPDLAQMFSTGKKGINETFWSGLIENNYESFKRYVLKKIENLEKDYGKISAPEFHLSYELYETSPKYFAGELSIAKHFTTVRVPAFDNEIIDLTNSIGNSILSFSQFLPNYKRGSIEENVLQAYMITKNNALLSEIPVHNVPPKIFSTEKGIYRLLLVHAHRIKNMLPKAINRVILGRSYPHDILEDWEKWVCETLKETISQLIFTEDSRIKAYLSPKYVDSMQSNLSAPSIPKLVTAELILRMFFPKKDAEKRVTEG